MKVIKKMIDFLEDHGSTLIAISLFLALIVLITACVRDTTTSEPKFKYAILERYDGEQIIEITSMNRCYDDTVEFTSTTGISYRTQASNVIFLSQLEK